MSELSDLYQEVIIEHSKAPRNFGKLADANHTIEAYNPLCGDQITLYVRTANGRIEDLSFEGAGCAISKASSSLMTQAMKGETEEAALSMFETVHLLLTEGPEALEHPEELGKLAVLSGVSQFPARVKCASLAWHALKSALTGGTEAVSTE